MFTELPVRLDDIVEHAIEHSPVDEFMFAQVPTDHLILPSMLRLHDDVRNGKRHRKAEILYSSSISDRATQRLACCKEILHAIEDDDHMASTRDDVDRLLDQIILPQEAWTSTVVYADAVGLTYALMVLLPRDALIELRAQHERGDITKAGIARIAVIPPWIVEHALDSRWLEVLERLE